MGLDNTTTPTVNAQQNWWGCPLGPGNAGCDPVSGDVDASFPLPAPPPCVLPTTTTTTTTTTITMTTTVPITPTTITPTTTTTTPRPTVPECLTDAPCNDGNLCNGVEACRGGVCTGGTPLDCDDDDPCTVDTCDAGTGCQHTTVADLASCSTMLPGGGKKKSDCYVLAAPKPLAT